jgi:molybdopterin converting factor small subunit
MQIEVSIPSMLRDCTKGKVSFKLEAQWLDEALRNIIIEYPLLRIHLYTESGELRKHVLIFYNDQSIAWLERLDIPLQAGDRIMVFQAVSGG